LIIAASMNGSAEVVELLLTRGANVNHADSTGVTPSIAAASVDDAASLGILLDRGADPDARAAVPQSATALMGAAFNGNLEGVRLLLARKPDLHAVSAERAAPVKNGFVQFAKVTALHMAVSGGNPEIVRLLLEAGVPPDPRDLRGMTPLMWATGTDRPSGRIVRLLIDAGADASARSRGDETVADWARKFNHPAMLDALGLPGPMTTTAPTSRRTSSAENARSAVLRSMGVLRQASNNMLPRGGCVACHAQPMTAIVAELAGARGWPVDRTRADADGALATMTANAPLLMQGREAGGMPDTQLYMTWMLSVHAIPASFATDAFVHYLSAKQRMDGNWHGIGATRAPMQDGDFSRTALAIRALTAYGIPARKQELDDRVFRAAGWLAGQTPVTTEDRVMQLLGLHWAGSHGRERAALARQLAALQRADGGWAQTPYLASDAYATGQVVYTLRQLGTPSTDAALQRGAAFLLGTQQQDGTWHVKSRAMKIQPYFESGFPYEHDQWISQTATAWAAMALAVMAP
jgi:hypothetical protein